MKKKHQRVNHIQKRENRSQKRVGLDSQGKLVGGSWEKVGNKNHLPQDSGLVEEDNCVMVVVGDFDMVETQDG